MEESRFFDQIDGDRVYAADKFAEYFRQVLTDGILNGGTNLKVYATGMASAVVLQPGNAWLQGYFYKNTADLPLAIGVADGTYDRVDRVVIRLDRRAQSRHIRAFVKTGQVGMSPSPPALQRDDEIWEISLARVKVTHNTSVIAPGGVTDERMDTTVCGLVNSLVQVDTTEMQEQFDEFMASLSDEGFAPIHHTHPMSDIVDLGNYVNQDVRRGSNPTFGTVTATKVTGAVYA